MSIVAKSFELHLVLPLKLTSARAAIAKLEAGGTNGWAQVTVDDATPGDAYSKHHFFLPHIRQILMPERRFIRRNLDGIEVELDGLTKARLSVARAEVRVFSDVAVLVLSLTAPGQLDLRTVQSLSHRLRRSFAGYWDDDAKRRNVPVAVTYIDGNRETRIEISTPSFLSGRGDSNQGPQDDILPTWQYLLEPLQHDPRGEVNHGYGNLYLEQVPCLRLIGVDGLGRRLPSDDDQVSIGLAEPLGRHPVGFRVNFLASNSYDRWWSPPAFATRYFVTELLSRSWPHPTTTSAPGLQRIYEIYMSNCTSWRIF